MRINRRGAMTFIAALFAGKAIGQQPKLTPHPKAESDELCDQPWCPADKSYQGSFNVPGAVHGHIPYYDCAIFTHPQAKFSVSCGDESFEFTGQDLMDALKQKPVSVNITVGPGE